MRGAAAIVIIGVLAGSAGRAGAEPLPRGSMGLIVGAIAGTGPDANRLGLGYIGYPFSFHAAWQPMDSEQRIGWTARWTTFFTSNGYASAAQIADLQTMQMDLTLGVRVRPGKSPRRYLTARAGPAMFRANQTIPPKMQRAFVGAVGSVGVQQYLVGTLFLLDFDLRYGLVGDGPSSIAFTAGFSINGP
ncbi:MAG: hypothetical protein H6Q90_4129 [Deltaproteobacteria bacterium]|nr:hypothetical protein [Deltaproteobacteria bacterium]